MAFDPHTPLADCFSTELDGVSSELTRISGLADGVARSISTAFRSAVSDGKSLNDVLGQIALSFSQLALKAALQPLTQMLSGSLESLLGGAGGTSTAIPAFAKGGVIDTPSYFPLGNGLGLAGEAGPEAIVPLARGADGSLGIAGGAGAMPSTSTSPRPM
jgi:phage-related minor tail protein